MSRKSKVSDGSGDRPNADDIGKSRSIVEPHQETDENKVESDGETKSNKSDGSEISDHLGSVSSTVAFHDMYDICDVSKDSETDKERDIQEISGSESFHGTDSDSDDEGSEIQSECEKDEELSHSRLHIMAKLGCTEDVRSLLMSSENIDVLDSEHNTPLHYASLNGHIEVVDLLLSKNAIVNSRNVQGRTPLHLASRHSHFSIAQMLLKNNADVHVTDQFNKTPIDIAARYDHCELVQLLKNSKLIQFPSLHFAAKYGNAMDVQQLLRNCASNASAANLYGDTPLHLASENGHLEVVKVLLRCNADANIRSASFKTPLHIAAEMGYAEIARSLMDHKGEANAIDSDGDKALHLAASTCHGDVINILLNQTTEMSVNETSSADEPERFQHPIRNAGDVDLTSNLIVAEVGNVEIATILQSRSATVKPVRTEQATTHAEAGKSLVCTGAYANAGINDKMTALNLACRNGNTSVVESLQDDHAVADVMKQSKETPFYLAARNGHADVTDLLLSRDICDFALAYDIQTPLHAAVTGNHPKVVEVIMKHSCRISGKLPKVEHRFQENAKNFVEVRGEIPVEFLKSDRRRVSAELVWREENTPIEIRRDSEHGTALDLAISTVKPEMVRLLLSGDQFVYSEEDLRESFESIIYAIESEDLFEKGLSDPKQHRMNLREIADAIINSSKFNVNKQNTRSSLYNTLLHDVMNDCRCSSDPIPELVKLQDLGKTSTTNTYKLSNRESRRIQKAMSSSKWSKWRNLQVHIRNDLLELLLEKGADFNMKNVLGETPLIKAAENGCCHAIKILFDWEHKSGKKLHLDARDRYGATALIKAAEGNYESIVRMLINHKASVNLQNYYGLTALHSSIYEPNYYWYDLHFFCKGLHGDVDFEIRSSEKLKCRSGTVDRNTTIGQIQTYLKYDEESIQFKEEVVKLLLGNDKTDVDIKDFEGNTPLDLAVKFSKRMTSATLEALRNRCTIQNRAGPEEEAPIEVARVDNRGRNPLHRLITSLSGIEMMYEDGIKEDDKRFKLMVHGILLRPGNFIESASLIDYKKRTPLHYAAMLPSMSGFPNDDPMTALLKLDSNVNAADIYGKTPLHYAENEIHYKNLVEDGAYEDAKDIYGYTPWDLKQLRDAVSANEEKAARTKSPEKLRQAYADMAEVLKTKQVTELSKQRLVETIRIRSQSPQLQENSEKVIWRIWTENKFTLLNRRLSQLKPSVKQFIMRLADALKGKDWRFECQPILVGSAEEEEAKVEFSTDFDFNFQLTKFSQLCYPFPHPLGPKGYFQLKKKPNENAESRNDEMFDCFFNSDRYLLTDEVNSRFQIILEEVFRGHNIWQDEHLFELIFKDFKGNRCERPAALCKTLQLKMNYPIGDGENGLLLVKISIDIVACIHVEDWWPEEPLPVGINSDVKANGCIFVFDHPRFNPGKKRDIDFIFSDTFARISFAPVETRIIKESAPVIKAAFLVCKLMIQQVATSNYHLKNCLFFCMEALNVRNGGETGDEGQISPEQLAFWVERVLFCLTEFNRHDVFPCYFMPSFKQKVEHVNHYNCIKCCPKFEKDFREKDVVLQLRYSVVYDIYLDLCPDDTAIDIPLDTREQYDERFHANYDRYWKKFDREEFIRKLASRSFK